MRPEILVIGQGLAGTLLAWELEQAGLAFEIADDGHATATSAVAAGLINPVTGQRVVKSWRIEALLPIARATYAALGDALGCRLWHDLRLRRFFGDDNERRVFAAKQARGELTPFVSTEPDGADSFWIEYAARVDLRKLLATARARWHAQGRLRTEEVEWSTLSDAYALVIDCRGIAGARDGGFGFVPWEYSKGEALEVHASELSSAVGLIRKHAVIPIGDGLAWVGATHEPGKTDTTPTAPGRAALESSASTLLGREVEIASHRAAVRVNLRDKHPVAGRHPERPRLGIINGLGAKGTLLAPWLAREWREHLMSGRPIDREVDVSRFWACNSSQALTH